MNDTFWGLYEAQISALRSCVSPAEANMIMLETAKFLVEHIDLSEATVEQYDRLAVRQLFAAHNALGSAVTLFYDKEHDLLDPVARNGAIGKRIATISEQIVSTSEALKRLHELEHDLFAKEGELSALQKELQSWQQKAAHLREIEATVAAEIRRYQEQYEKLDAIIANHGEALAFWKAHLGEDSTIICNMKDDGVDSIEGLLSSIDKLQDNIRRDLDALDTIIRKIVEQEAQVRETVLRKQNKMV